MEILDLLRGFAKKKRNFLRFQSDRQDLCACEPRLERIGDAEVFTATLFKVRSEAFPAVIGPDGPERLELPDDRGLGEFMCFAYDPVDGRALMLYSPTGPRRVSLREFLQQLGFPHGIDIEPMLRRDMMERLDRTTFVQSLLFRLKDVRGNTELRAAGLPVATAIDLVDSVDGADIRVEVSIRRPGRGLATRVVKSMSRWLLEHGETHVTQLQLSASEAEEMKCEKLNLLNAQIELILDLTNDLREIDRRDCQKQLAGALKEKIPAILKKKVRP